ASFFFGIFFCYILMFNRKAPKKIMALERLKPPFYFLYFFLIFNVLACIGVYGYLKSLSSGGFFEIFINLEDIRRDLAIGDANPELIYRILNKFNLIIPTSVFLAALIYLTKPSLHAALMLFLIVLTAFLYSTLLLQRALFLLYFMFFVIPILYNSYSTNPIAFFRRAIFFGVLFFVLIGLIVSFRSSSEISYSFVDYMYSYIIGSFFGLDAFLNGHDGVVNLLEVQKNYITTSGFNFYEVELGVNSLKEFRWIYPLLGIEQPSLHGEYIYSPVMTNIYTIIRPFYQDFWLFGVFMFSFLFGFASNFVYVRLVKTGS
ncbi:O-antigen polymerase, partial [Vibrio cholerae]